MFCRGRMDPRPSCSAGEVGQRVRAARALTGSLTFLAASISGLQLRHKPAKSLPLNGRRQGNESRSLAYLVTTFLKARSEVLNQSPGSVPAVAPTPSSKAQRAFTKAPFALKIP